jgi:hypothetical protein
LDSLNVNSVQGFNTDINKSCHTYRVSEKESMGNTGSGKEKVQEEVRDTQSGLISV